MKTRDFSKITPEILQLAEKTTKANAIDPELYTTYDVKRGLRDINGKGVLAGLTEISEMYGYETVDGEAVPCDGKLFYRGISIEELVQGFDKNAHNGFEETTYLLLFGSLPNKQELEDFQTLLASYRSLPTNFVRDVIMKAPSDDMMNSLARSVLTLYSYDKKANDTSIPNVLRQCLQLISTFPMLCVYGFHAYNHYRRGKSLFIHQPQKELTAAENFLHMLRVDSNFTPLEARLLDLALVLHAEHGGGNNSTFTTHVVSSSGTDTYSSTVASLGSLKGPRHGGANIKVVKMFEEIKTQVKDWKDEEEVTAFLQKLLNKEAFDKSGLIYGMGHAVYSISDPRATVFRGFVEMLSKEKGREDEFQLYQLVERLAPEVIGQKRKIYKGVSANVDFYSGFAYDMLELPASLYTPLFAIARIVGWSAHRMEELSNNGRIIRPAYKAIHPRSSYITLEERP